MKDNSKKLRKTKNALKDRVRNVEGGEQFEKKVKPGRKSKKVTPEEIELVVPFNIASRLNRETSIRGHQINLRKKLCVFMEQHFDDFVKDYQRLGNSPEPAITALRMRLFAETVKIILPRPKEIEDADTHEQNKSIINRLLGKE
jgi:hypothetical protein